MWRMGTMESPTRKQKNVLQSPGSLIVMPLPFIRLENLTFIDVIIWLAYLGIIYLLIKIVRRISFQSQKKPHYISGKQKTDLINKKQILRVFGPVMIIVAIGAYIGIWVLLDDLPSVFIHLLILMIAYLILEYIDVTIEDRVSRSPPHTEKILGEYEELRYKGIFKKLWYMNSILLLLFCLGYTQVKGFPFHGIWGIIAWSLTIVTTYSPAVLLYIDMFKELAIPREKILHIQYFYKLDHGLFLALVWRILI
jgi:hypothetical protein